MKDPEPERCALTTLAMNLEEGGDMLKPMAVGAIGGLSLGLLVALFLLPCFYLVFTRKEKASRPTIENHVT